MKNKKLFCLYSPIVIVVTNNVEILAKNAITDQNNESLASRASSFLLWMLILSMKIFSQQFNWINESLGLNYKRKEKLPLLFSCFVMLQYLLVIFCLQIALCFYYLWTLLFQPKYRKITFCVWDSRDKIENIRSQSWVSFHTILNIIAYQKLTWNGYECSKDTPRSSTYSKVEVNQYWKLS